MKENGDAFIFVDEPGIVGTWSGQLPVSDPGIETGYLVTLTGIGDLPAIGSASAEINVHIQEGGDVYKVLNVTRAEDLSYSELTTASGDITLFSKKTSYNSRVTGATEFVVPPGPAG